MNSKIKKSWGKPNIKNLVSIKNTKGGTINGKEAGGNLKS